MNMGKEEYVPARSGTSMASRVSPNKVSSPKAMRPKGSFMNPTASKQRKEVNKQDLFGRQTEFKEERATLTKKRATDLLPYEQYHKAIKAYKAEKTK